MFSDTSTNTLKLNSFLFSMKGAFMPAHHAHYYFGKQVIRKMPASLKKIINNNGTSIDAFLIGLQGPDILEFYKPYQHNALNREGAYIHHHPGYDFFNRAGNYIVELPSIPSLSYLYGSICHYMLDSACHPIVEKYMQYTGCTHMLIERAFDQFLLTKEGCNPIGYNLSVLLPQNTDLGLFISPFYHSATPKKIVKSITDTKRYLDLLNSPNQSVRRSIYYSLSCIKVIKKIRDMVACDPINTETLRSSVTLYSKLEETVSETILELGYFNSFLNNEQSLRKRFSFDYMGNTY